MPAQIHSTFEPPKDRNVKIWRYMGLAKFVWMLQNKALYFSRSDLMGDPYEGHYTRITAMSEDAFVAAQMSDPMLAALDDAENVHRRNFRIILARVPEEKRNLFISCWHMNEHKSLAMWKLYANHQDLICIQSTYQILANLLPNESFVGTVRYIDYEAEYIQVTDVFQYIVHKRKSFEHERELRAVLWTPSLKQRFEAFGEGGLIVPIDLSALILNIHVSPNSDPLLENIVSGLARTYGIGARVKQSGVNSPPSY